MGCRKQASGEGKRQPDAAGRTPKPTYAKQPLLGGWRIRPATAEGPPILMVGGSAMHRCRRAVKREDGTATTFLWAQPSSLPRGVAACSSPVTRRLSLLLIAAPALSTAASFPLLTRRRGRPSGSATGKTPSPLELSPCPESHDADIPKEV